MEAVTLKALLGQEGSGKMQSDRNEEESFFIELKELNDDAIVFDGPIVDSFFDCCIVGYGAKYGDAPVVIYDEDLMIERLIFGGGLSHSQASEYVSVNISGHNLGEGSPILMRPNPGFKKSTYDRA